MNIILNEISTKVPLGCVNLAQLLLHEGYSGVTLRITVDCREIPLTAVHDIILREGMRITVCH